MCEEGAELEQVGVGNGELCAECLDVLVQNNDVAVAVGGGGGLLCALGWRRVVFEDEEF